MAESPNKTDKIAGGVSKLKGKFKKSKGGDDPLVEAAKVLPRIKDATLRGVSSSTEQRKGKVTGKLKIGNEKEKEFTLYYFDVVDDKGNTWECAKRFSDFRDLKKKLIANGGVYAEIIKTWDLPGKVPSADLSTKPWPISSPHARSVQSSWS